MDWTVPAYSDDPIKSTGFWDWPFLETCFVDSIATIANSICFLLSSGVIDSFSFSGCRKKISRLHLKDGTISGR